MLRAPSAWQENEGFRQMRRCNLAITCLVRASGSQYTSVCSDRFALGVSQARDLEAKYTSLCSDRFASGVSQARDLAAKYWPGLPLWYSGWLGSRV